MRWFAVWIPIIALLAGCATATRTVKTSYTDVGDDGEREIETVVVTMEYKGGLPVSPGRLVEATDRTEELALGVASQAIDAGVPVSVRTGETSVSAGYQGYGSGGYNYGTGAYVAGTTMSGGGGYYVAQTGGGSGLPVLGSTGYTGGASASPGAVFDPSAAKCPSDSSAPRSVEEDLACSRMRLDDHTRMLGALNR